MERVCRLMEKEERRGSREGGWNVWLEGLRVNCKVKMDVERG